MRARLPPTAVRNGDTGVLRVHAVHFAGESELAAGRLREAYPSHYEMTPTLYLIRSKDLSNAVAETVGIKGENRIVDGVVFKLNPIYSGYYDRTLWDWLGDEC